MNRIILIGNGFDLAHLMPTSYKNFIDDYWQNVIEQLKQKGAGSSYNNEQIEIKSIPPIFDFQKRPYENLTESVKKHNVSYNRIISRILFRNKFLEKITKESYLNKWVDIENEYYKELKNILKDTSNHFQIETLNNDLETIKNLLIDYLNKVESKSDLHPEKIIRIKNDIGYKIYFPYNPKDFSEEGKNKILEIEFNKLKLIKDGIDRNSINRNDLPEHTKKLIDYLNFEEPLIHVRQKLFSDSCHNHFNLDLNEVLFLTFNYTFTEKLYKSPSSFDSFGQMKTPNIQQIHIHGTIDKYDKNPIIFGYGDELDDDYLNIEKLNDNRFLDNIKSIKYSESDNYKKVLEFVNSDIYQIFIMGHSCGTSDRTLLNTLFEHENCVSIKTFYHQKDDENDNFSDVIRNISRNFNDKTKMRDRVVNKIFCQKI